MPINGASPSRLIVTACDAVPPALVAWQLNEVPFVSCVTVLVAQPDWAVIGDSGSLTCQLTVTLARYQPLSPSVPATENVMMGGVESTAGVLSLHAPNVLAANCQRLDEPRCRER